MTLLDTLRDLSVKGSADTSDPRMVERSSKQPLKPGERGPFIVAVTEAGFSRYFAKPATTSFFERRAEDRSTEYLEVTDAQVRYARIWITEAGRP